MFARYLGEIGSVGQDIARLYRHFVDWNLKKLFVLVYFGGTALLLSVPFAVLVLVIGYNYPDLVANLAALAAGVNAGRPVSDFLDAVAASAVPVAGIVLAIGGIVSAFLFASVYSVTLLSRIYLGYVRGERTRIASLPLLSWPLAKRVVGVFAWQGLWLLAGLVAVVLAFASARWILGIESSLFYGICAVVVAAVLAYVIVRMSLVFGALAQDTETGGWRLARESWSTFAGWRWLAAILTGVPYFVIILLLAAGFDQLPYADSTLGSIVWFLFADSVELMIFISIYARAQSGVFLK